MKRSLKPQWTGNGNLGDFEIEFTGVTPETLETLAKNYATPFAEFVNAQAHIKFSGPEFVKNVRLKIERAMGEPEKGKGEKWYADNYENARGIAKENAPTFVLDANTSLLAWAKDWKPAGEKSTKKVPVKGFGKLVAALGRIDLTAEQTAKVTAAMTQIGAKDLADLEARFVEAVDIDLDV